jgi:gas vesicle protein
MKEFLLGAVIAVILAITALTWAFKKGKRDGRLDNAEEQLDNVKKAKQIEHKFDTDPEYRDNIEQLFKRDK